MDALWPGTFVEEGNLSFQISVLRKMLGENAADWVETLARYGYRFNTDVIEIEANDRSDNGSRAASPPARSLVFAWLYVRQEPSPERLVRFLISRPDGVNRPDIDSMSVSPDGERLVFIGVATDGRRQHGCGP